MQPEETEDEPLKAKQFGLFRPEDCGSLHRLNPHTLRPHVLSHKLLVKEKRVRCKPYNTTRGNNQRRE